MLKTYRKSQITGETEHFFNRSMPQIWKVVNMFSLEISISKLPDF